MNSLINTPSVSFDFLIRGESPPRPAPLRLRHRLHFRLLSRGAAPQRGADICFHLIWTRDRPPPADLLEGGGGRGGGEANTSWDRALSSLPHHWDLMHSSDHFCVLCLSHKNVLTAFLKRKKKPTAPGECRAVRLVVPLTCFQLALLK